MNLETMPFDRPPGLLYGCVVTTAQASPAVTPPHDSLPGPTFQVGYSPCVTQKTVDHKTGSLMLMRQNTLFLPKLQRKSVREETYSYIEMVPQTTNISFY